MQRTEDEAREMAQWAKEQEDKRKEMESLRLTVWIQQAIRLALARYAAKMQGRAFD